MVGERIGNAGSAMSEWAVTCHASHTMRYTTNRSATCAERLAVYPPLQARERADHDDAGAEAAPHAHRPELREDLARRLVALAHLGHHLFG